MNYKITTFPKSNVAALQDQINAWLEENPNIQIFGDNTTYYEALQTAACRFLYFP
jgi:hypothetical protein